MNPVEGNASDGEPNASQIPVPSVLLDIESAMLTAKEVAAILHIGVRSSGGDSTGRAPSAPNQDDWFNPLGESHASRMDGQTNDGLGKAAANAASTRCHQGARVGPPHWINP